HVGDANDAAHRTRRVVNGDGDSRIGIHRLGARAHVAAFVAFEVAGGHRFVALPGETGHSLAARDALNHLEHLGRDVQRRVQFELVTPKQVHGARYSTVPGDVVAKPRFESVFGCIHGMGTFVWVWWTPELRLGPGPLTSESYTRRRLEPPGRSSGLSRAW